MAHGRVSAHQAPRPARKGENEMIKEIPYKDREEWLAIRKNYIGGSDAGAVIGLNPYRSAYTLWAEKTGKLPEFEGNVATQVGAYLEEFVAKMFEEETGKKVRRKNRVIVNDDYPFACANLDRVIVGEKAFLEIKTTTSFGIMRQCRGTEFPEAYYAQVVHYLAVTELEKAYLAVLVNCRELKIFELERDEEEIKALMDAEEKFWTHVKDDTAPDTDGSDSTADTISALYPASTDAEADLTGYRSDLINYSGLKAQKKEIEGRIEEIENRVKAAMGESARGVCDGYKVSFASQERRTFDSKKLSAEHPELKLDGYYKVSVSRPFKVTEVA